MAMIIPLPIFVRGNEEMKKSEKGETLLLQLLEEMVRDETMDCVVQRLRQTMDEDAPTSEAVRRCLMTPGGTDSLSSYQRVLVIDQLLECAEVNFRTLCDLIRYRHFKSVRLVNSVEEFLELTHPDEEAVLREDDTE